MTAPCEHLEAAEPQDVVADQCPACVELGSTWVHLRYCLVCGNVGCCDQSPNRHASRHAREQAHPVATSAEAGENWIWCYEDERGIQP